MQWKILIVVNKALDVVVVRPQVAAANPLKPKPFRRQVGDGTFLKISHNITI